MSDVLPNHEPLTPLKSEPIATIKPPLNSEKQEVPVVDEVATDNQIAEIVQELSTLSQKIDLFNNVDQTPIGENSDATINSKTDKEIAVTPSHTTRKPDIQIKAIKEWFRGLRNKNPKGALVDISVLPKHLDIELAQAENEQSLASLEQDERVKKESTQIQLTDDIKLLENQLVQILNENPLPAEFAQSFSNRQDTLNTLREKGLLGAAAVNAVQRILNETMFLKPLENLGFKANLANNTLIISSSNTSLIFGSKDIDDINKRASFSVNMSGKPEIKIAEDIPDAQVIFSLLITPNYFGQYPLSVARVLHEGTHNVHFSQQRVLAREKRFDHARASPVLDGRPLAEATATCAERPLSADSSREDINRNVRITYASQVNASQLEWDTAFEIVDNLRAVGLSTPEITYLQSLDSQYTETGTLGELRGSYPFLEKIVDGRLVKLGLTRQDLPQLRHKVVLQGKIESQRAASICREELNKTISTLNT